MGKVQALRATASERSPARTALADAISKRAAYRERLTAIDAAFAEIRLGRLEEQVADAKAAVEQAKSDAGRYLVDSKINGNAIPPVSVKEARAALQEAEDELEAARAARAALKEERNQCEMHLGIVEGTLRRTITEVIATDPAIDELLRAYARSFRECENLRCTVDVIFNRLTNEQKNLIPVNGSHEAPLADAMRAAILTLEKDADCPFPQCSGS